MRDDNPNAKPRTGVVTVVDGEKAMVRVRFDDLVDDNGEPIISHFVQVCQSRTFGDREYWMPDIGEQVRIDFDGRGIETAYAMGGVYSEKDPPPVTDPNKHHVAYKDGSTFEYDRKQHLFAISISGEDLKDEDGESAATPRDGTGGGGGNKSGKVDIFVEETTDWYSKGKITIKTDADILVQAEGKVDVIAKGDITAKTQANAYLEAEGNADLKVKGNVAGKVDGNYSLDVGGNYSVKAGGTATLEAGGNVKIDGSDIDIG